MKKTKTLNVVAMLTAFLLATITVTQGPIVPSIFAAVPDEPHTGDAMWVEPSTIDLSTDTVSVGHRFNVTVWINLTVTSLSWEFKLIYKKNLLNATGCAYTAGSKSDFFKDLNTLPLTPTLDTINTTHNYALHGEVAFMSERSPGYGSLAWVEFEVIAVPSEGESYTSPLDIATNYPGETYAQDPDQKKISLIPFNSNYRISGPGAPPELSVSISPTSVTMNVGASQTFTSTVTGGTPPYSYQWYLNDTAVSGATSNSWAFTPTSAGVYPVYLNITDSVGAWKKSNVAHVTVNPPPPPGGAILYVNPQNITDPTMEPSSIFTINITIANVSDMRICEFNLTYNPDIIGFMGIILFKVQNQVPTTQMVLDDEVGFLWVKLVYQTGITTESSPLVAITFHMESYGESVLDLHNTILTDSDGEPIPHEARDGLFLIIIRDVAIIDVYPSRNWTYIGLDVNVTVVAKNLGDQNETFTVTAYYDNLEIGNLTVEDLQPNDEITLIFVWDTNDTTPCNNYTISAKASTVPYEMNTTNNEHINGHVKIRILGDINGDGKVRVDDVYLAAEAFGSYPGHPRWEPAADLNGDGKIRVDDVYLVAINFGADCSS
jgi:hypothetical protein